MGAGRNSLLLGNTVYGESVVLVAAARRTDAGTIEAEGVGAVASRVRGRRPVAAIATLIIC